MCNDKTLKSALHPRRALVGRTSTLRLGILAVFVAHLATQGCTGFGSELGSITGPSCPKGITLVIGADSHCADCLVDAGCVPAGGETCSCPQYEACFCACRKNDTKCHDGCLASSPADCRRCAERILSCAATTCASDCSDGGQWIGDAGLR